MYCLNFSSSLCWFATQYNGSEYWWVMGRGKLLGFVSLVAVHTCSTYKPQSVPAGVAGERALDDAGTRLLIEMHG